MIPIVREIETNSGRITAYYDEYSRRIRIDDYQGTGTDVTRLIESSITPWVEKIIIKSKDEDVASFENLGYRREASIAGYFSGMDMHFLVRYLSEERSRSPRGGDEEALLQSVLLIPPQQTDVSLANIAYATEADAPVLARLYADSFRIYPTPVSDPEYIRKTMTDGTVYVLIRDMGRVVSAASAEINEKYRNAELTDCATAEGYEGKGQMRALLTELENHLKSRNITCLYTIARSASFGMNKVFHQLGYKYGGRMTKNCMIYSGMEDMNVWYKR